MKSSAAGVDTSSGTRNSVRDAGFVALDLNVWVHKKQSWVDVQQTTAVGERTCPAAFLVRLKEAHGPRGGFLYVSPRCLGADSPSVRGKRVDQEEATTYENRGERRMHTAFPVLKAMHIRDSRENKLARRSTVKQQISAEDQRKEEEELQMALVLAFALSVQNKVASPRPGANGAGQLAPQSQPGAQQGTTAATVCRVRVLYDFTPSEPSELAFDKGDVIAVVESVAGVFPLKSVEKLQDPTREELGRNAQTESRVFGEIKTLEKRLALLGVKGGGSRRGKREEEEIGDLYQRTFSIRAKLIELVGKSPQQKARGSPNDVPAEQFTKLNEKFIIARRDFEHLREDSMKAPQHYQQYPVRARQPCQMYPPQQHRQPYGAAQQSPPPQGYPP
ncbi:ESCRT-0 subunit protein hse1 [Teratosphaeriaceae sp. CCFEE 6253]|nr:ESCRT-0 subunit protein hse1 [Teratosphaeriaceae sp. CCFEE 6253]